MPTSLFGHLAHNFSVHPENLATEALAFILRGSQVSTEAFCQFLEATGAPVPRGLHFETQVSGDDDAIPDLVGVSRTNSQPVIGEAKFWAGLTENQPVTYLKRLPESEGGLVVFLAPTRRLPSLWPELLRRCNAAGLSPEVTDSPSPDVYVATCQGSRFLAATSWRSVLNAIRHALETEGDLAAASDVRQLEGLCDKMDSEAFLPLRPEDLSPAIGSRILQFNELVDALTDELVGSGLATTTGLKATPTFAGYGRYMILGEFGCMLQVNALYWSTLRETPIWLSIKAATHPKWTYSPVAKERLSSLEHEVPPRLLREADALLVPLHLAIGMDKQGAVHALRQQLHETMTLLDPPKTRRDA